MIPEEDTKTPRTADIVSQHFAEAHNPDERPSQRNDFTDAMHQSDEALALFDFGACDKGSTSAFQK
jgi:hypothetical protein